ncbi:MAG: FAD-binding oxidoreductase, partial [Armatimonadota bacterium]
IVSATRQISECGSTITIQGARTGITAGAVPSGGHVLNLSKMNAIGAVIHDAESQYSYITVQPGALLTDIRKVLEGTELFFPPDPTETSASIGGMVSCNASGAMTLLYGQTRVWIEGISVVLADGSIVKMKRRVCMASGRQFRLLTEDGLQIAGTLPSYTMPDVKSAAGYYSTPDMDMIDLFIGMEGTLGIITEIDLRLAPKPSQIAGLMLFMPSEDSAIRMVRFLRGEETGMSERFSGKPAAIEFFNHDALDLLRKMKAENPAFAGIPHLQPHYHTAIYMEFHASSEDEIDESVMQVMEAMAELGVSDEDSWYAGNDRELETHKSFRHAIPEAVNLLIGERKRTNPNITKLGTDMSVPDNILENIIEIYNSGLKEADLESVIFGHIGNNHLHVNILPRNTDEYIRGKQLYLDWARYVVDAGGSISAEHGIGKLKTAFLELMYGKDGISQMIVVKNLFDPEHILNPGNLFSL